MIKHGSFWLYLLILLLLYIIWGDLFNSYELINDESLISQIVFNFAVFYPVGLLAGVSRRPVRWGVALGAGLFFNIWTYLMVLIYQVSVSIGTVAVDFISMFAILFIGIYVGTRGKKQKGVQQP